MLVNSLVPPPLGAPPVAIAEGVLWMRLPIPFALNHVNVYFLRDGDGWLAVDSGTNGPEAHATWAGALAGLGGPHKLTRLLVTHHHIDHVGAAGWLARETECEVLMSPPEIAALHKEMAPEPARRIADLGRYGRQLGCSEAETDDLVRHRLRPPTLISAIPERISTLAAGDSLTIDGARWRVDLGGGHAHASVMLTRSDNALMVVGDQILAKISPFVGIFPDEKRLNPLQDYLDFLADIARRIRPEALLLPGHGVPFRDGAARTAELAEHHRERCDAILAACAAGPQTVRALVASIFTRDLQGVLVLALAEILAHARLLVIEGRLNQAESAGSWRFSLA